VLDLVQMEIKMVFKQHRLQYEPPLEELRIRHYKDCINTFLGLPLKMKGVSDLSDRAGFFRPIAEANPSSIAQVYSAVEALFVQLNEELKKYQVTRASSVELHVRRQYLMAVIDGHFAHPT
jgi:dynein heavy chain 2, cytosolic